MRSTRKGRGRLREERVRDLGDCFRHALAFLRRAVFQEFGHVVEGPGLIPVADRPADVRADGATAEAAVAMELTRTMLSIFITAWFRAFLRWMRASSAAGPGELVAQSSHG